ncbi:MAG: PAS domain-containing sensor histidine kinase [Sutterellaceae bacterium]|nr:PAS domain-containing sensor histidine kinase [Burkholderiaceae bacterium]MDW8429600.1 PAS domain-containing sensor histidine kinase [Sutterellaceae bacterium]
MRVQRLLGSLPASIEPGWRALAYFSLVRVLMVSALVLTVAAFGVPLAEAGASASRLLALGIIYFLFAAALAVLALYLRTHFTLQVFSQLSIDLILISTLVALSGGVRGGMMILYLLPIAGAALLLPTIAAFFVCALAVLVLLGDAVVRGLQQEGRDAGVFQAGLYGAALFGITALLGLLSRRLTAQETLARRRGRDLERQLEINRLVIAHMEQGVLVVDANLHVRANNRAARTLLGFEPHAQLTGRCLTEYPHLRPLALAFRQWLNSERPRGDWSDTVLQPLADGTDAQGLARLRVRARFARPGNEEHDEFVIFLEDMRAVEDRAQQLKLAAMGRLTASIAHEIRNPLAAISHASQLLNEDADGALRARLVAIVRENTARLNRLVDDVLRVARRETPVGEDIALDRFVRDWLQEFARDRALPPGRVHVEIPSGLAVRFEQSHLRQILFNLVDNALRYASEAAGAVQLIGERAADEAGRVQLWVFDDGPGVSAEARAALFEPFFTTHARGTGLGLYIAREFCLANGCELAYAERRALDGSTREGFVLRFARSGDVIAASGYLDTVPVL